MALKTPPTMILQKIATSLVAQKRYQTVEEALWEIAISSIREKMSYYQERILKLEKKYGMDFEQFTHYLKNCANPAEEDDWFAWRSARNMMNDWEKSYQDLHHARPC